MPDPDPAFPPGGTVDVRAEPSWIVPVSVAGIAGVCWYVGAWAVAGRLTTDHDPTAQAISELFAVDAPRLPSLLVRSSLVGSGLALVAFAVALDRGLPGDGRAGPVAAGVAGVMTVAVVAVPCTPGCPGFGTSPTDSAHSVVAGAGYLALLATPLLVAARVRRHAPSMARVSVALGAVGAAGFAVRALGWFDDRAGMLQRFANTVVDAWYVGAAVALIRRARRTRRS